MSNKSKKNVSKKHVHDTISHEDRKRKALSIEEKFEIIKRFEKNERTCDIVRATGINEATLRTIRRNAEKIKASFLSGTSNSATKCIRTRRREIEEMEHLLTVWIDQTKQLGTNLNFLTIKEKALSIYENLRNEAENPDEMPPFNASTGWFVGFKKRHSFENVKLSDEAVNDNEDSLKSFSSILEKLIEEEGYSIDQIFNIEETGLYWKRMPSRTCISKEEATSLRFKSSKDMLTVMLGANASGDLKLKPVVVYHTANPQALKGIVRSTLGVYFRCSERGLMTEQIFADLLLDVFEDIFKDYCQKKNLDYKILILLKNVPSHPPTLAELSPNIKVLFLPPNITSVIQPLDQSIIATFKHYYTLLTFKMLFAATEVGNAQSVLDFWKRFNITNAINIIVEAWNDIKKDCLQGVWRHLLRNLIRDFKGFDPIKEFSKIKENCVILAKQAGFDEVEEEDLDELLYMQCHVEELSTEDLQLLATEEQEEGGIDIHRASIKELSTSDLSSVLIAFEHNVQWLEDNDYNAERSRVAVSGIRSYLEPYKQLLFERKKMAKQRTQDVYFKPSVTSCIPMHTSASSTTASSDHTYEDLLVLYT